MSKETAKKFTERGIESIADLVDMEDEERTELLGLSQPELMDVVRVCNRFPSIDLTYEIADGEEVVGGEQVTLQVGFRAGGFRAMGWRL